MTPETLYHCKLCGRSNFTRKAPHKAPPGGSRAPACPGDFEPITATACFSCCYRENKACPDPTVIHHAPWRGCGAWMPQPAPTAALVPAPKSAIDHRPSAIPQTLGTWDSARRWLAHAGTCERMKVFCQVMLGFELLDLQKQHGLAQCQESRSQNGTSSSATWDDVLEKEIGLAKTTAYRFAQMARAAAPRLKKIPALKGFDPAAQTIASLTDDQKHALETGVRKLTDGLTQREFGESLGAWKKDKATAPGRKTGDGGRPPGPVTPDEVRAVKLKIFREESLAALAALDQLGPKFIIAEDEDMIILQGLLSRCERHARALHLWLDAAPLKRDEALANKVADLFKL